MSAKLQLLILDHQGNRINESRKQSEKQWTSQQTKNGHFTQASSSVLI